MGERVVLPEVRMQFEQDGMLYTFIGWSPVTDTVTADVTYTAMYSCVNMEIATDIGERDAIPAVMKHHVYPVIALALGIVALVLVAMYLLMLRRRKK